uniref:Selenoprotein M n=1 Tax=Lepisosteus oculatus TaxID=7918 RepID=W5MPV3_LEPOC
MWVLLFVGLVQCLSAYDVDLKKLEGLAKAKVELRDFIFCALCDLNRLREVKAFVTQDIPLYHNLVMKHIPGADPELVLLNHYYEELDRIPLTDMSRAEINALLGSLGFYKKSQPEEPVPEELRFAPAKDSPWSRSPE